MRSRKGTSGTFGNAKRVVTAAWCRLQPGCGCDAGSGGTIVHRGFEESSHRIDPAERADVACVAGAKQSTPGRGHRVTANAPENLMSRLCLFVCLLQVVYKLIFFLDSSFRVTMTSSFVFDTMSLLPSAHVCISFVFDTMRFACSFIQAPSSRRVNQSLSHLSDGLLSHLSLQRSFILDTTSNPPHVCASHLYLIQWDLLDSLPYALVFLLIYLHFH